MCPDGQGEQVEQAEQAERGKPLSRVDALLAGPVGAWGTDQAVGDGDGGVQAGVGGRREQQGPLDEERHHLLRARICV